MNLRMLCTEMIKNLIIFFASRTNQLKDNHSPTDEVSDNFAVTETTSGRVSGEVDAVGHCVCLRQLRLQVIVVPHIKQRVPKDNHSREQRRRADKTGEQTQQYHQPHNFPFLS